MPVKELFQEESEKTTGVLGGEWQATRASRMDWAVDALEAKAEELVAACRTIGADGQVYYPPQVGSFYPGFWLRDFVYMLDGCPAAVPEDDLRQACTRFLDAQSPTGDFPECIGLDGKAHFRPGLGRMGENPVADSGPFMVGLIWHFYQRSGDRIFLERAIRPLVQGMRAVPRHERTELVHVDPNKPWERCTYGFTDSVRHKGDVLFASLLFVQAARQLADLMQSLGRDGDADMWRADAHQIAKRIRMYFWDKRAGLFRSASKSCCEHDLWGSAFAVYLNVATSGQLMSIANHFRDHFDDVIMNGQVRHLPDGVCWEDTDTPAGTYQNGAFWAAPAGWVAYTLDIIAPDLADRLILDLLDEFQTRGVHECVSKSGIARVRDYAVSAALPLEAIRRMQLRREKREGHSPGSLFE